MHLKGGHPAKIALSIIATGTVYMAMPIYKDLVVNVDLQVHTF